MLIIGMSGRKQSGKNTAATHIREYFGNHEHISVKEYSYADYLKQTCIDLFGLTHEQCYGTDAQKNSLTNLRWGDFWFLLSEDMKEKVPGSAIEYGIHKAHMTGREVLQVFGTNVIRRIYGNAWVDATIRTIREDRDLDIALITDVRFPNEVAAIQENGGKVFRLTRIPHAGDVHESETALDPENFDWSRFDAVVYNDGLSVEEQRQPVLDLVKSWF